MLVDLARNDVGRVVEFGTAQVDELMTLERYSHVMHLTSQVSGELAEGRTPIDVLRATLPAGTVSGAPKVRAMEIIDELEPTKRGPYAGVVGYLDFSGNIDTAIAIRTMVVDLPAPDGAPGIGAGRRRRRGRLRRRRRGARDPQQGQGAAQRHSRGRGHDGTTEAEMTDVTADYLALRRDVAAVRVPCEVIRAFGADSATFLQGQLSADVVGLRTGEWVRSLLLDPQGKLVAWLRGLGSATATARCSSTSVTAPARRVMDRLNRFRLRVHCELELLSWECVAVRGPNCPAPEDLDVRSELRAPWTGPVSPASTCSVRRWRCRQVCTRRASTRTRPCASRRGGRRWERSSPPRAIPR